MSLTEQGKLKLIRALPLSLALGTVVAAASGQELWDGVFYRSFSFFYAVVALIAIASVTAYAALLLQLLVGRKATIALRLILLFSLAKFVILIAENYISPEKRIPVLDWLIYLCGAVVILRIAFKLCDESWINLNKACTVAGLIFITSFPFVGWMTRIQTKPVFDFGFLKKPVASENVVFLLLDETSPELADPIIQAASKNLKYVQHSVIESADKNTSNVIPAMLSGTYFHQVMPCGTTTLCTERISLDFSQLQAANKVTDVFGVRLPYCSIKGLRSCMQFTPNEPGVFTIAYYLIRSNYLFSFLPHWEDFMQAKQLNLGGQQKIEQNVSVPIVDEYLRSMSMLPFWKKGGLLYAHLNLPHPNGSPTKQSLAEEYDENVRLAADFVTKIIAQLKQRFGDDFIIVITSDHPLRVEGWCSTPVYARPDCAKGLPENKNQVPFIVGSQKEIEVAIPTSNLGLLINMNEAIAIDPAKVSQDGVRNETAVR